MQASRADHPPCRTRSTRWAPVSSRSAVRAHPSTRQLRARVSHRRIPTNTDDTDSTGVCGRQRATGATASQPLLPTLSVRSERGGCRETQAAQVSTSATGAQVGGMGVETRGGAAAPSGQAARVASVEELVEGARMARLAMGCYRNFESVAKEEGLFCVAEGTSHRDSASPLIRKPLHTCVRRHTDASPAQPSEGSGSAQLVGFRRLSHQPCGSRKRTHRSITCCCGGLLEL